MVLEKTSRVPWTARSNQSILKETKPEYSLEGRIWITHLEPDILECELKWALGSITRNKASGGNGISDELFQILKDEGVKVLHSKLQQIWKTQQWPHNWKTCFHSKLKERQCKTILKLPHNCTHLTRYQRNGPNSPSQASIVCEL